MYLDFISDIAKVGDSITIVTKQQTIEGEIIKISSELIAVKTTNGAVFFCKDEDILELNINNSHTENTKTLDSSMPNVINDDAENVKASDVTEVNSVVVSQNEKSKNLEQGLITIGNYDSKWDQIDKQSLLINVKEIYKSLTRDEKTIIIASNASVREVLRRTFRVTTEEVPKLSVNLRTIIENALLQELLHFSIGDSLPVVIYYHQVPQFELKGVFLTLLPNTIAGYLDLLKQAIEEGHYRQAKSLCYFLRSQSIGKNTLWRIGALIKAMKSVNAFIKDEQENIKSATKTKIPRYYKDIEKHLNELIKKGEYSAAITKIDEILGNLSVDNKYKSSLLLRKAQTYSSITDYKNAQNAYISLIEFNESVGGESKNLSHLYTELARLQAMDKMELGHAQMSAEKALRYNPQNRYAATLLEQIKTGSFSSVCVTSNSNTSNNANEDKELIIDSDESTSVVSKMLDIDIKEYHFTHPDIINNGGTPTSPIAKKIYEEAKSIKDVDLSERYPVYLEAAKAFSELPIGSYDSQEYLESIAYYAILKGNSLFLQFKKLMSEKKASITTLTHIKDSACSYYIESLNLLSSIESEFLLLILGNYLKMNIALIDLKQGRIPNIAGQFNKVFFNCISSNDSYLNIIAWSTVVIIGTASPREWNKLNRIKGGTSGLYGIMKSTDTRKKIYSLLNQINSEQINTELLPGEFLKATFALRKSRNEQLRTLISKIQKVEFDLHLLSQTTELWAKIPDYIDLFNETEIESKSVIDNILVILTPYVNRNQIERTNLLIQAQKIIDEQLTFINDNTTYYGRTFYFPLLIKWKRIIMITLEKKIADTMPQLVVVADPPYIVDVDGTKIVNLLVKNVGESTAEGCVMIPNVIDLSTSNSIKGKNIYNNEIPSGNNLDVPMNLPPAMNDVDSIKLVMSISPIYQGKELEATEFEFTLEKEPESSLRYEDIPWNDGPIPVEQMFKGRKQILDMLTNHYMSIERDKPYILYGLTRTGKSSILKYLGNLLDKKQITISGEQYCIATFYWDLSQASSFGNNRDMWEYLLFDQFNEYLDRYIGVDGYKELSMPEHPRAKELNNALNYLHKKHIYPIFFVDEFSFIKVLMDNSVINPAFLHTLRQFSFEGKAGFIYAGTYDVDALLEDPKYGITGQLVGCKKEQISEIDKDSAEELIQVLGNRLVFTREAIDHIHRLSGDVPYFVQMICKYCGFYAVENKRSIIGYPELEHVIKILTGEISSSENSLVKTLPDNVFQNNMFSPADPKEVNVLITSIVHFNRENKEHPRGVSMVELQELWATKKVSAFTAKLADSIELLTKKKVLKDSLDEDLPVYTLNVDLFRRWWSIHHPDISVEIGTIS